MRLFPALPQSKARADFLALSRQLNSIHNSDAGQPAMGSTAIGAAPYSAQYDKESISANKAHGEQLIR